MSEIEKPISVSKNFAKITGDTAAEVYERLVEFNNYPGMAEQLVMFEQTTSGKPSEMQQAVANVQAVMPATVVEQQPTPPPAPTVQASQPGQPAPTVQPAGDWGQAAPTAAPATFPVPSCEHGPRNAVAKNGWKGWFCPLPQEIPKEQKCKTTFLSGPGKQGHNPAEWAAFPK